MSTLKTEAFNQVQIAFCPPNELVEVERQATPGRNWLSVVIFRFFAAFWIDRATRARVSPLRDWNAIRVSLRMS